MLSCDYGFFRDPGGALLTFLVVHVQPYGVYVASVVDAKGNSADGVRYLASVFRECGLIHVVFRSDREASLKALLEQAIRQSWRHGTPVEQDHKPGDLGADAAGAAEPEICHNRMYPETVPLFTTAHSLKTIRVMYAYCRISIFKHAALKLCVLSPRFLLGEKHTVFPL